MRPASPASAEFRTGWRGQRFRRSQTALLASLRDPIGDHARHRSVAGTLLRGFPILTWYQAFTYVSFLLSVWIGRRLARTESVWRIGSAVLLSSLQFFLITNIGSWLYDYPHTLAGLGACYVAAIPFFQRTLLADFFYTGVLFGLHAILTRTVAPREQAA